LQVFSSKELLNDVLTGLTDAETLELFKIGRWGRWIR